MADLPAGPKPPSSNGSGPLSMEKRLLLAFALMALILFVTPYFYKPGPAPKGPGTPVTPQTAAKVTTEPVESGPAAKALGSEAAAQTVSGAVVPGAVNADKEELFSVDTELYQIKFSNKGAVVSSWILKKYTDSANKPLQVVSREAVKAGFSPFAIEIKNQKLSADLSQALFVAKPASDSLGVDYEFSDGQTVCRKSFRFLKDSYLSKIASEVTERGVPVPHLLVWRGGFGDATIGDAASGQHSLYYDLTKGKLIVNAAKAAKNGPFIESGTYSFLGLEDSFFGAVFLPRNNVPTTLTTFSDPLAASKDEKPVDYVGVGVGGEGQNQFSLFVGPKDFNILRKVDPKLEQVVDFGQWFGFLAKPLFLSLNWVADRWTHNYGWAIIVVTVIINFLLLPLKFTSMKSAKKMQALQPQIAAINAKYKDVGMRDPRKAEQNAEVMALYKKHGANPMGGCLPMVLQIPFFIAFYQVLSVAIELRGAHWLWVSDLSQHEMLPIHILPILMIATQFLSQKMTPTPSSDPAQAKVMMLMPLMFGFMFYSVKSGLVLYWLTGNVVGIVQQWFINRTTAAPKIIDVKPVPVKKTSRK